MMMISYPGVSAFGERFLGRFAAHFVERVFDVDIMDFLFSLFCPLILTP